VRRKDFNLLSVLERGKPRVEYSFGRSMDCARISENSGDLLQFKMSVLSERSERLKQDDAPGLFDDGPEFWGSEGEHVLQEQGTGGRSPGAAGP
jgi:hypothetical protein